MKEINFFHTEVTEDSILRVNEVLYSGWLNEGKIVKEFEDSFAHTIGGLHPVAVNSGTSALHLALAIAGVKEGDEVILPAQTFVATGMVILMQNAIPVFADIDLKTGNISYQSIKEKITRKTKAIIPVHWGGYPCDLDEINQIADEYHLTVIEDAAHALGASYKKKPIGSISQFTAFSFQAIKHMTTGDGGMLCCLDLQQKNEAIAKRWFGIDRSRAKKTELGSRIYDIQVLGYKYHMNNIEAALGLGNLYTFKKNLAKRRKIAEFYRSQLNNVKGIELLDAKPDRKGAYWLFTLLVENRYDFVRKLSEQKIPSSVVDLGIDNNSVFSEYRSYLPRQLEFNEKQISIPIHPALTQAQISKVVEVIKTGW